MLAYPTYKGKQYAISVDNDAARTIASKAAWDEAKNRWTVRKPWHTTLANALWTAYSGDIRHGHTLERKGFVENPPENPNTQMYDYTKAHLAPYFEKEAAALEEDLIEAVLKGFISLNEAEELYSNFEEDDFEEFDDLDAGPLRSGESDFEKAAKFNSGREEDEEDLCPTCQTPFYEWEEDEEGNLTCPGCGYSIGADDL